MMNDSSVDTSGLLKKTAALLDNKRFSDVEIQVIHDGVRKTFYAHKLFLAIYSEKFQRMFYGPTSACVCKIINFKPEIVHMMLEFIYTNKVSLVETMEARELYSLAKNFEIRNLQEHCVDYISTKEVNNDNVLKMYDCALRNEYLKCLDFCRNVVSSNTRAVLESPSFPEASFAVLEDILKQDTLKVDNELEILKAVISWAFHECKKKNLDDLYHLRTCIYPLLPYIRFLTLKCNQFCDIVEKYPIFTAHESSLIKNKLLQPEKLIYLPSHICKITRPRIHSAATRDIDSRKVYSSCAELQTIDNGHHSEKRKRKQIPVSKVRPHVNDSTQKALDFSLQEAEKHLGTAFKNDVKCTISINVLKGMIIMHGVELKISQGQKINETMNVFLNVSSGGKNSSISDTFTEELQNDALILLFKQPVKVLHSHQAEIEVTIEDLILNRCCVLKDQGCKLENCSEIVANFTLTSNQINDKGEHFFLVSRLIYSLI